MNMNNTEKAIAMQKEVSKIILGLPEVIKLVTAGIFSQGHILLEGFPGTAKTLMLLAFARTISGGGFSRISGKPDLLPQDALFSTEFLLEEESHNIGNRGMPFSFSRGPLLAHGENLCIFLFDEINRVKEKVQAVVLEPMQEFACTVGTKCYPLPYFILVASRNPLETEETHELPEAQRDRFLLEIDIPEIDEGSELRLITDPIFSNMAELLKKIEPVITLQELQDTRKKIQENIYLSTEISKYILQLVRATRAPTAKFGLRFEEHDNLDEIIRAGLMPRASVALAKISRVMAWMNGRNHVSPEDIQNVWLPFATHRFFLKELELRRRAGLAKQILNLILEKIEAPCDEKK